MHQFSALATLSTFEQCTWQAQCLRLRLRLPHIIMELPFSSPADGEFFHDHGAKKTIQLIWYQLAVTFAGIIAQSKALLHVLPFLRCGVTQ
jgi:hypothetical protein